MGGGNKDQSYSGTGLTQQSENFGYSAVRLRRIAKLQFGIVNPNELVRFNIKMKKTGGRKKERENKKRCIS